MKGRQRYAMLGVPRSFPFKEGNVEKSMGEINGTISRNIHSAA